MVVRLHLYTPANQRRLVSVSLRYGEVRAKEREGQRDESLSHNLRFCSSLGFDAESLNTNSIFNSTQHKQHHPPACIPLTNSQCCCVFFISLCFAFCFLFFCLTGFVRKVYLTLMIQLLLTVGIICAFLYW